MCSRPTWNSETNRWQKRVPADRVCDALCIRHTEEGVKPEPHLIGEDD